MHIANNMSYTGEIKEYVDSLTEKERQGFEIAKDHLGCTFHIEKSIGFKRWKTKKEERKPSNASP